MRYTQRAMDTANYYNVLGVRPNADFAELRKAYRTRAMECHPDRFGGDPEKAEEFKTVGIAFNVLSDPFSRRDHDLSLGATIEGPRPATPPFSMGRCPEDDGAILDTLADDILEELIVGNVVPRDTSLQTLMRDLEQTERFCLFREAKTCLYSGETAEAELLFRRYVSMAPINILARYFLSKCCRERGNWEDAEHELRLAIRIGARRSPPLQLPRLRRELEQLRQARPGLLGALRRIFLPQQKVIDNTPADKTERRALNRTINRLARERLRSSRTGDSRRSLPPRRD